MKSPYRGSLTPPFADLPSPRPKHLDNLWCHRCGQRHSKEDETFVDCVGQRQLSSQACDKVSSGAVTHPPDLWLLSCLKQRHVLTGFCFVAPFGLLDPPTRHFDGLADIIASQLLGFSLAQCSPVFGPPVLDRIRDHFLDIRDDPMLKSSCRAFVNTNSPQTDARVAYQSCPCRLS